MTTFEEYQARADVITRENITYATDEHGVVHGFVSWGAGGFEAHGNTEDEVCAMIAEQVACELPAFDKAESNESRLEVFMEMIRDEAQHAKQADSTQIASFLVICAKALAEREGKTLDGLWQEVYKAAEATQDT